MNEQNNIKTPTMCSNCGGQLEFRSDQEFVECPYCGTRYHVSTLLDESDEVRLEKIKLQEVKEQNAAASERMKNEAQIAAQNAEIAAHEKFRKGIFSKVLIVLDVISLFFTLSACMMGWIFSGIIGTVITVLFLISWLLGMQIIMEKKRGIHILVSIIAFLLIIPFFACSGITVQDLFSKSKGEEFEWEEIELHDMLPQPDKLYGKINSNSSSNLSLDLQGIENKDYKAYKNKCIEYGYTLEADDAQSNYTAFNEEGYRLYISFWKDSMDISLQAPEKMSAIEWPEYGLAALLPKPDSDIGNISWDDSENFAIDVGNTPIEKYKEYVKACEDKGFTINHSKSDDYYSAENKEGYKLTVEYMGMNVMNIYIQADEDAMSGDISTPAVETSKPEEVQTTPEETSISTTEEPSSVSETEPETEATTNVTTVVTTTTTTPAATTQKPVTEEEKTSAAPPVIENSLSYTTNDLKTAKLGNTGVFSYKSTGGTYSNYYIIDFDEGYVYFFSDGNGSKECDRVKIVSGDLNSYVLITYHEGGEEWSEALSFKWVNQPDRLVVQDGYGFKYDFNSTNLKDALAIRDTKVITDY